MLDFIRTGHHFLSQARRQSAANPQLTFKPGRKPITFRQSRRQMIIAIVVPLAHRVTIMIAVIMPAMIIIVIAIMSMSVTVTVSIRARNSRQSQ